MIGDLYAADFKLETVRDLQDDHMWLINWRMIIVAIVLILTLTTMLLGTVYDIMVYQKYLKAKKAIFDSFENNNTATLINGN